MNGKWRRRGGRRKTGTGQGFSFRVDPNIVAEQAMRVIMASPTLKAQLKLFSGRSSVDRSSLDGIFKGGAFELAREGLIFGRPGGKKFSLTSAGIIALRILETGS